jgi:hypothetical protein
MTISDDLIEALVTDLSPMPPYAFRRRMILVTSVGVAGAMLALAASFAFRSGEHEVTAITFMVKFLYAASIMVTMVLALGQVARPDGNIRRELVALAIAFASMSLLAIGQLAVSPKADYAALILGRTSLICPFLIMGFGMPAFCLNFWFLRRAAPTRPKLAGFIAGACAGAIGAWVYSWACVESGFPFVAVWYSLGVAITGFVGAVCGSVALRW